MSTNSKGRTPTVIEIIDSSEDSDNEGDSQQQSSSTREESTTTSDTIETSPLATETTTDSSTSKEIVKKVHNRRKSVHNSIRSMDDLSFESVITRGSKANSGGDEESAKEAKKRRWDESNIDAAIDDSIDDPEMTRMLKKIAYCRVFTNYLLRQYDMLAIDFKLYSNIDLLMLELKKRVDTYTAIRRSRQRLLLNREINGNL